MLRLGLRLALNSGREALVRLLATAAAIAIGVTVLLAVIAEFHAFEITSNTPHWESARSATDLNPGDNSRVELWNHSESIYKGQTIEQVGVAALGPQAPVMPGVPRLPSSGQYYASPALAALLKTVPRDELGDRFAGVQVGTIGEKGLTGPGELAIVIGYSPSKLTALPNTVSVDTIATKPKQNGTTNLYREAFGIGAIAILFPLLILIGTATKLASARREERYAAMRLTGFTPHQINIIASIDAMTSAFFGTLAGIGLFLLVRPVLAEASLSGVRFFADYVTPTVWGYIGMLLVVPSASAFAALFSLRRVQISPLGVSKRVRPSPPSVLRILPLTIGIPLFVVSLLHGKQHTGSNYGLVIFSLLCIMSGLIVSGPWLTLQISRLLAKSANSTASLLAARRLADNPKTAFRLVSGMMLAIFVGTAIAVLAPAEIGVQSSGSYASLNNVLRVLYLYDNDLTTQQEAGLMNGLQAFSGVAVTPIYANPALTSASGQDDTPDSVIDCASLKQLPELGSCTPGITAVTASADKVLSTDNPLTVIKNLPIVSAANTPTPGSLKGLPIHALLVKADNANTVERVRTFLSVYDTSLGIGRSEVPETYGEVAQIRNNDDKNIELVILAAVILTLLVAGCSLAVTVGGSLIERKRAFTLLRLSGISASTLYRVVLLESLVPLAAASLVAGAFGYAVAIPVVRALEPAGTHVSHPGSIYYITVGVGLAASVMVVVSVLPLLERITRPDNARFE